MFPHNCALLLSLFLTFCWLGLVSWKKALPVNFSWSKSKTTFLSSRVAELKHICLWYLGLCIFCCWYFGHIYSSPIIALFIVSASSMLLQLHFYLQNPLQNYFMFFLLILDLKTLKRGENFSGCFVGWWTWDKVIFWIFEYCTFATNIQIHTQIAQIQIEKGLWDLLYCVISQDWVSVVDVAGLKEVTPWWIFSALFICRPFFLGPG